MESKCALTGAQTEIEFRTSIRKRKMKPTKIRRVLNKVCRMTQIVDKKEPTISLQRQLEILVPQQNRNIAGVTGSSPHFIPKSTRTMADSISSFKPEELTERRSLPLSTSNTPPPLMPAQPAFRASLLQLQQYAKKSG